jgi:hypothetical protein
VIFPLASSLIERKRMGWKYEYQSDLNNEIEIINKVKELWKCDAEKMSGFSYADFILTRGVVDGLPQGVAFCEIRVRSTNRFRYDTIFISLNKYKNMLSMSEVTGMPSLFVVQWADECAYMKLTKENEGLSYPKRRKPRGEDHKDEPCVHLSVKKFTTLWKSEGS